MIIMESGLPEDVNDCVLFDPYFTEITTYRSIDFSCYDNEELSTESRCNTFISEEVKAEDEEDLLAFLNTSSPLRNKSLFSHFQVINLLFCNC